jgi:hypothetical protein
VWQGFINVSESFSYKDSLFILATKKGKKILELILPSYLIFLAYMGLHINSNGPTKSYGPFERVLWSRSTILPHHRVAIPHVLLGKQHQETPVKI